jgi:hypothetical protein
MAQAVAYYLLVLGILLLAMGLLMGGLPAIVNSTLCLSAVFGTGLAGCGMWLRRIVTGWKQERRVSRAGRRASPLAEELTPLLFGSYNLYVMEAAEKLGEARDATAVPALLCVLERCVDSQRPGWREVGESLVTALERIGDRRALSLLYRLETVRGIGFIPSIRSAIAAIEPQTSLLRPGSADYIPLETLLRPAEAQNAGESPAVLLRATDSETR